MNNQNRIADPLPQNIEIFRDNNFIFICQVRSFEDNSIYDLTDFESWFAVKSNDKFRDEQILIAKTTEIPSEGIIKPDGIVEFYLTRSDTAGLKQGIYFWDIGIYKQIDNEKITVAKGQMSIIQPIVLGDPWDL